MIRPLASKGLVAFFLVALAFVAVAPALAEQSGRAGVVVSFNGSFSPQRVPRERFVPITLNLEGSVRGAEGSSPPRVDRIELAFGARSGLDTTGLPICRRARLRNATRRQALERCRGALVGHGEVSAEVPFNPERPILARAAVLAFNGTSGGRPAVWLQAYSASPPVSFTLPFYVRRLSAGAYGVVLRSPVRDALGRWPNLRSFQITLGRRYSAGGERRSYLSARCPLPPRFTALSVPLARATYYLAPRPTISQTILRRCRVRE